MESSSESPKPVFFFDIDNCVSGQRPALSAPAANVFAAVFSKSVGPRLEMALEMLTCIDIGRKVHELMHDLIGMLDECTLIVLADSQPGR